MIVKNVRPIEIEPIVLNRNMLIKTHNNIEHFFEHKSKNNTIDNNNKFFFRYIPVYIIKKMKMKNSKNNPKN